MNERLIIMFLIIKYANKLN